MAGLNDSFTVGIILIIILGGVFFYFYTRLGQVEKRMKHLEIILLDLKVATENSFVGFPSGAAVAGGAAAAKAVVAAEADEDDEEAEAEQEAEHEQEQEAESAAEAVPEMTIEEVLQASEVPEPEAVPALVINEKRSNSSTDTYDYMTVKELHSHAKQLGITGTSGLKRQALIDVIRQYEGGQGQSQAQAQAQDEVAAPVNPFEDEMPQLAGDESSSALFGQMAPIE